MMIASALHLTRADLKALKVTDAYSLHRVVYDLFDDVRSMEEKQTSVPSGILYADKGGDFNGRKILMLSNRQPKIPEHGELNMKKITDSFLDYKNYRFEVVVNPTKYDGIPRKHPLKEGKTIKGKTIPLKTREEIAAWFIEKSARKAVKEGDFNGWGFEVSREHLEVRDIEVKRFIAKDAREITLACAKIVGILTVTDKAQFIKSFQEGIGRGRAFGCGLLQIIPL
ncbi:type I-E CRISPR-associated protein Cas6/Cse3/CasE [Methylosoma difficile]